MRKLGRAGVFLLLAGCVSVPPLEEDGIAIGEIVQRVKCEIAFAVPEPQPPYPTGRYQFMRNWTAKVDLTLIANGRSTITPTATFLDLLPFANIPKVSSNIQRNITLGVGGGLDTTAERTEVLSFSLSLAEMLEFKRHAACNLPAGRGLYGNLGLREWLDSALAPVVSGQLKVGRHPRLGAKSAPPPPVVIPKVKYRIEEDPLAELKQAKANVVHYQKVADTALARARDSGGRDKIQATYDEAGLVLGAAIAATPERKKADTLALELGKTEPTLKDKIVALHAEATEAGGKIDAAKTEVEAIIKDLPRDPPIDSLSHSVKFVVAVSGSVSPNWVLVHFRGPSTSSNLLSGAHTRTHTLSISMGSPEEQARVLNNLVILQSLRPVQ